MARKETNLEWQARRNREARERLAAEGIDLNDGGKDFAVEEDYSEVSEEAKDLFKPGADLDRYFDRYLSEVEDQLEPAPIGRPQGEIRHGTVTGYRTERRRGLDPCPECLTAKRLDARQTRARKKLAAANA